MRYAVIEGNSVINVIDAEEGFALDGYELVQSDTAGPGWVYENGVFSPPSLEQTDPPSPVETPPQLIACALRIQVEAGEVQAVSGAFRVAAIMMIDHGTFLVIFFSNLGATEPFLVPNNGISSSIVEWGEDYAVIETRDAAGALITPACFGFSLYNF